MISFADVAEIAKSIYAAEESEELNMEDNKEFTGMNPPEETTGGAEKRDRHGSRTGRNNRKHPTGGTGL